MDSLRLLYQVSGSITTSSIQRHLATLSFSLGTILDVSADISGYYVPLLHFPSTGLVNLMLQYYLLQLVGSVGLWALYSARDSLVDADLDSQVLRTRCPCFLYVTCLCPLGSVYIGIYIQYTLILCSLAISRTYSKILRSLCHFFVLYSCLCYC